MDGFYEIERDEKEMISIADLVEYIDSNKNSEGGKRSIPSLKDVSAEKITFADLLVCIGSLVETVPKESLTLKSITIDYKLYSRLIDYTYRK